jgi:hypothetical protein
MPDRPPPSPEPGIDALRQRLRELGYLDAGVDRFVLGAARRTRGPAIIAALTSIRIGVLAALLLGPAAVIGLIARVPGLITGLRDGVVAALYLGVFFGVSVSVMAFAAALLASWASTRRGTVGRLVTERVRALSVAAGIVVSAASLVYLTLWWRTANAGINSLVWTGFALAVAVAISVTLGHAVMVSALAVALARPSAGAVPRMPGRSWKASIAASGVAFIGAAALLFAVAGESPHDAQLPPLTVASSGTRVLVLAIDGFDLRFHERLLAAATVPRAVLPGNTPRPARGDAPFGWLETARADLAPSDSADPARLWTTIATGVRPERHGVTTLEPRRIAGLQGSLGAGSTAHVIGAASDLLRLTRPAVASNFERRVKTFWEVAEQAGLKTAVVNWWATWPADASGGIVISDRAIVRLDRGGALDAELAPPDVYGRLKPEWARIQKAARSRLQSRMSQGTASDIPDPVKSTLERSAELDATITELATEIRRHAELDLLVVYLPGLDIVQHTLFGGETGVPPSELNVRIAALEMYYEFLSRLTRDTVANSKEAAFVITQPGRLHAGPGILAAMGRGFGSSVRVPGTSLDVAPTILHALGVPAARDLDGHVLGKLFSDEALTKFPVRYVATYGQRRTTSIARGGQPLDQETIDRLRSLGYVR